VVAPAEIQFHEMEFFIEFFFDWQFEFHAIAVCVFPAAVNFVYVNREFVCVARYQPERAGHARQNLEWRVYKHYRLFAVEP
jgi:uncharacterized membrane protein